MLPGPRYLQSTASLCLHVSTSSATAVSHPQTTRNTAVRLLDCLQSGAVLCKDGPIWLRSRTALSSSAFVTHRADLDLPLPRTLQECGDATYRGRCEFPGSNVAAVEASRAGRHEAARFCSCHFVRNQRRAGRCTRALQSTASGPRVLPFALPLRHHAVLLLFRRIRKFHLRVSMGHLCEACMHRWQFQQAPHGLLLPPLFLLVGLSRYADVVRGVSIYYAMPSEQVEAVRAHWWCHLSLGTLTSEWSLSLNAYIPLVLHGGNIVGPAWEVMVVVQ